MTDTRQAVRIILAEWEAAMNTLTTRAMSDSLRSYYIGRLQGLGCALRLVVGSGNLADWKAYVESSDEQRTT